MAEETGATHVSFDASNTNGYDALPFIIINETLIFEMRDRAAGQMREPCHKVHLPPVCECTIDSCMCHRSQLFSECKKGKVITDAIPEMRFKRSSRHVSAIVSLIALRDAIASADVGDHRKGAPADWRNDPTNMQGR
jgi:hypothetical protein